jgi:dTDP-glucose 4,6-dehydratase
MSGNNGPINIGNPVEMTIKQFAEKILEITGAASGITYRELPIDDPKVRQPDITRARTLLGWEPAVDFDKGIRVTIDYFRTKLAMK